MKIAVNEEKNIVCSGFYSEKGISSVKGIFYTSIDYKSGELITQSFEEFKTEFIEELTIGRTEKRKKKKAKRLKELYNFRLNELLVGDDGSTIIVAEQYSFQQMFSNGFVGRGASKSIPYYFFNDIIVVKIDSDGAIEWTKRIPKYQFTVDDEGLYSSYSFFMKKDKMYFIYNDNLKNITEKSNTNITHNFTRGENAYVCICTIDLEGNMKREVLIKTRGLSFLIRPNIIKKVKDNELIIFGRKGIVKRFLRIIFDE